MRRVEVLPRDGWEEKVSMLGVSTSARAGVPLWMEASPKPAYYSIKSKELRSLEVAAEMINHYCMESIGWLLGKASKTDKDIWFDRFGIPADMRNPMISSWNKGSWGFVSRFDFLIDGDCIKLLRCHGHNPDTFTESAEAQLNWFCSLQGTKLFASDSYQFNSMKYEVLCFWKDVVFENAGMRTIHIAYEESDESLAMANTIASYISKDDLKAYVVPYVALHQEGVCMFDNENRLVEAVIKCFDHRITLEYGNKLNSGTNSVMMFEPYWKMLLSNSMMLALLYERHPKSQFLTPAYPNRSTMRRDSKVGDLWVEEPVNKSLGIEPAFIHHTSKKLEYVRGARISGVQYMCRKFIMSNDFSDTQPTFSMWVVGEKVAGLSVVETSTKDMESKFFVPHVITLGG